MFFCCARGMRSKVSCSRGQKSSWLCAHLCSFSIPSACCAPNWNKHCNTWYFQRSRTKKLWCKHALLFSDVLAEASLPFSPCSFDGHLPELGGALIKVLGSVFTSTPPPVNTEIYHRLKKKIAKVLAECKVLCFTPALPSASGFIFLHEARNQCFSDWTGGA